MRSSHKSALLHAALLALLLLVTFVFRSLNQAFYSAVWLYLLVLFALTAGTIALYFRTLQPVPQQGQGTVGWYVVRGWVVALLGAALAASLTSLYAYQVDPDFFERRLEWEQQLLVEAGVPEPAIAFALEAEKLNEPYHAEELVVGIIAGLSGLLSTVVWSVMFGRIIPPKDAARL